VTRAAQVDPPTEPASPTGPRGPLLVVIDMQQVFADPASPWAAPRFAEALPSVRSLLAAFGDRAVLTRFVAPEAPEGAWVDYYRQWPFARQPPTAPLWDLVPHLDVGSRPVLDAGTFGKWDARLAALVDPVPGIVLVGVSTDCCVLSTALAAADAGVAVRVAADACAGATDADHHRALDAMALYAPLVAITTVEEVLATAPPG
jgi:nicotinamidase-related amidase